MALRCGSLARRLARSGTAAVWRHEHQPRDKEWPSNINAKFC